jgi:ABC-type lipoprotein release transport system permease subunit
MFRRIIYEDWQLIFPIIALAVASCIYLVAAWRASRMKPAQAERFARMPLDHD